MCAGRWDKKVGRALMEAVIEEGRKAGKACIMLQQVRGSRPPTCLFLISGLTAWLAGLAAGAVGQVSSNTKSFCLYQSLGFRTVENCEEAGLLTPPRWLPLMTCHEWPWCGWQACT